VKVLLWNRPNAREHPGGDTVQWEHTGAELQRLGLDVTLSCEPRPDVEPYEVVHLFNLQRQDAALPVAELARAAGKRIALSTIWWDPIEAKYVSKHGKSATLRVGEWVMGRRRRLARFRKWKLSRKRSRRTREEVRRLVEISDVLLPNSVGERRMIEDYFGLGDLSAKTAIVPNATSFEAPSGSAQGPREGVICVGRIYPLKNQANLIRALIGLDVPLLLVGDSSNPRYERECRRLAREHGRVRFLGRVGHDALPELYSTTQAHVLPSFQETTGLVSLEAATCGSTVVTTDRGPTEEYFGAEAYYLDPADLASIRHAVEQALAHPLQASPQLLARYTWERAALATRQAYRWLLDPSLERPTSLETDCTRYR
jgi:glycosyltransferase involved in cell wall biosynthesis